MNMDGSLRQFFYEQIADVLEDFAISTSSYSGRVIAEYFIVKRPYGVFVRIIVRSRRFDKALNKTDMKVQCGQHLENLKLVVQNLHMLVKKVHEKYYED